MRLGVFLIISVLILGCASVENRYITSLSEEELSRIRDINVSLLEYRFSGNPLLLQKIEARVTELLQGAIPNREYKAELLGFLAETKYFRNDANGVRQLCDQIENESAQEARIYTLRAVLEKNWIKRLEILSDGLTKAKNKGLVLLSLAELYFDNNDFRSALAAYDEALPALDTRYKEHYGKKRDLAFQFIDQSVVQVETREILAKNALVVEDAITLLLVQTSFFSALTPDKNIPAKVLLFRLKEKIYFYNETLSLSDPILRKDIAFLLLNVLAYLENNPKLLFQSQPDKSPVPDIAPTDYYYNAVLTLVEREIIDLPDGKNFVPFRTMSGIDFFEIIKKLQARYGK